MRPENPIEIGIAGAESRALLGRGLLDRAGEWISSGSGRLLIIESIRAGPAAARLAQALGPRVLGRIPLDDQEEEKALPAVAAICDAAIAAGVRRDDALVAVGGGVTTDVAGFAAAILLRGIPWHAVPTTTAAMADAAIGGKTGVNHPRGKNLLGAFHPPRTILIDPEAAAGLSPRDHRAGLVEAFKACWIADREASRRAARGLPALLERDEDAWFSLLADAVEIKARIVSSDLREGDSRRLLNFGHTLGHAFEAASGFGTIRHGEAVAWGIAGALSLSRRRAGLPDKDAGEVLDTLAALGPFPEPSRDPERLLPSLASDKKATSRGHAGVLLEAIGRARVEEGIAPEEWLEAARDARIPR